MVAYVYVNEVNPNLVSNSSEAPSDACRWLMFV